MMPRVPSLSGWISVPAYAAAAPALLLLQHILVAAVYRLNGEVLIADQGFWLLPLRRLAAMPGLSALEAALAFLVSLLLMWILAVLSFRRASRSGGGFGLAGLSLVPAMQLVAVAILILLPIRAEETAPLEGQARDASHILQGVLMGAAIIVFAVLLSAVTFGAYGWGLFVLTPFLVGATTAYVANRRLPIDAGTSISLAVAAAALGSLMLLMLALEGLVCILLVAPLALVLAVIGAAIGRSAAIMRHKRDNPVMSLALLPAVFALEAAIPPDIPIVAEQAIIISAPPSRVWAALTDGRPIASPPGLVGRAGLAYPLRGQIVQPRVGGERLGLFSTGSAHERITEWTPGRSLAFEVLKQPPAMEEMSPYRRVHAPHVEGYFDTEETRFRLESLPRGETRLVVEATHVLRIDPVLYWEPIARWAIRANTRRVLLDIKAKAERRSPA